MTKKIIFEVKTWPQKEPESGSECYNITQACLGYGYSDCVIEGDYSYPFLDGDKWISLGDFEVIEQKLGDLIKEPTKEQQYKKALEAVLAHLELIGGDMSEYGAISFIIKRALGLANAIPAREVEEGNINKGE